VFPQQEQRQTIDGGLLYWRNMKEIALTNGYVTTVDNEDYDRIFAVCKKWNAKVSRHTVYACGARKVNGKFVFVSMHRIVMNVSSPDVIVDHIDGNGLNNKKSNLRTVTPAQNCANMRKWKTSGSIYKGVWENSPGRWRAGISFKNKTISLGTYDTELEAAIAYDKKARELFGEFAHTNF
jgi:hypothetical protein